MATWTDPASWSPVDPPSSTKLNANSQDLAYLAARPLFWKVYDTTSSDYSSLTSTSWTDIDATNLIATITTYANPRVLLEATINATVSGGGALAYFDWTDGTTRSHISHSNTTTSAVGTAIVDNQSRMTIVVRGLFNLSVVGASTFKLQYKAAAGASLTVFRNARPITISAWEL